MKTALSCLIITLVLAAGFAAWQGHARVVAARDALARCERESARLAPLLKATEERLAHSRAQLDQRPASSSAVERVPPSTPGDATRVSGVDNTATRLDRNPGLSALFRRSFQADLAVRFRGFYARAGLTLEQIREFEREMTEAELAKMDLQIAAQAQGLAPSDASLAKLREDGASRLEQALTKALGASGVEQLQEYRRLEPVQAPVLDVAKLVALTDSPLSAQQADRLATVLANASAAYQYGGRADVATLDWTQAIAAARAFLTPTQLAVLEGQARFAAADRLAKRFLQEQPAAPRP